MDTQNDKAAFMALIAHELSHIFQMINCASVCALDSPDKRYLEDIRRASETGHRLLRRITLLSRPNDSERHPLRKHRIRAIVEVVKLACRESDADVQLPEDRFVNADIPILEDALHQMMALARHGDSQPSVEASVVMGDELQICVRSRSNRSLFHENLRADLSVQFLERVAEMHNGRFTYECSSSSYAALSIPMQ